MADTQRRPPAANARIWAGGFSASAMLLLVAGMALTRREAVPAGQFDPRVWWHVGRASGLIAWALLGVSVTWGMTLSTSLAGRRTRSWTTGVHTFLGVLAVVFTGVHMVSVLAADELLIGWVQLVVPFTRTSAPLAQACGVLAWYLMLAVAVTSWLRGVLPWRWWRGLHLLSFPLFALACAHTVMAGSDADHPLFLSISAVAGLVILFLFTLRLLSTRWAAALNPGPPPAPDAPHPPEIPDPEPAAQPGMLTLVIAQQSWEAEGVVSLVLRSPDGAELPAWEPGAHLELALPSGRSRHYSLFGDPARRDEYRIAVLRQDTGRGGSREIHTTLRPGLRLAVHPPRNNFRLEPAPAYLFVAGGIGITGLLAMAATAARDGVEWRFVYGGRSRARMALVDQLTALDPKRVDILAEDERGRPDLVAEIAALAPATKVYCCGPPPLLARMAELIATRPDLTLHVERFGATTRTDGTAFTVKLERTGTTIEVAPDRTVLQAVRDVLPGVASSCEQGVCGSCRTRVLAGEPDHRDQLLTDQERTDGDMLICVSRAKGEQLTLDL